MDDKEISKTGDALKEDAAKLKKNIGKVADDAKEHAMAHVNYVKGKAGDQLEQVIEYARENPLHIAAGAFVLGFLIGITRRK